MRDYKFNIPDPRFLVKLAYSNFNTDKLLFFRSSLLTEAFIGKKAFVYDGRNFRFIFIKPEHLAQPVGSFIFTKRTGMRIHTDKSKKKKLLLSNLIFSYFYNDY